MASSQPPAPSDLNGISQLADQLVNRAGPSTRIIRKTERSLRTNLLQKSLKPIGARLIKPGKATPEGSPEIHPPEEVFDHCNVRQRHIGKVNVRLYEINARSSISTRENFIPAQIHALGVENDNHREPSVYEPSFNLTQTQTHEEQNVISKDFASRTTAQRRRKHIYYFAGGGWQSPAAREHWLLCANLAHSLTTKGHPTTVTLVSYPLAPNNPASKSLPILEALYHEILPSETHPTTSTPRSTSSSQDLSLTRTKTKHILPDEDIIFAGDSAGGNIALALPMMVLAKDPSARVPRQLMLISPAVDLRNLNPEMQSVSKNDPIMSVKYVNSTAAAWLGSDMDASDPRVSPLLGDIAALARKDIVVNGVIAGYDVLGPDGRLFAERCRDEGVPGEWLDWDKMMHCFPLASTYNKVSPESIEAVQWIMQRIMDSN